MRTFSDAKQTLDNLQDKLRKKSEVKDLDYWDLIAFLNIDLCLLLVVEDEIIESKWDEVIQNFKKIWRKAGSEAKRAAELEHIDFLTQSLNLVAYLDGEAYKPNKDLETRISELRIALGGVRNKLRPKMIAKSQLEKTKSETESKSKSKPKPKSKPKK